MKTLAIAFVMFVVIFFSGSVGFSYAGCPDWHGYCYADAGNGRLLGKVTVGKCWKWNGSGCDFCRGNKEPVRHCNGKYVLCLFNCWACDDKKGNDRTCWDKHGNRHDSNW